MTDVLDRSYTSVVFAWEAMTDSSSLVRDRIESLCGLGITVVAFSELDVDAVDGALSAYPVGPGALYVSADGGSKGYRIGADGPQLIWQRSPGGADPSHEAHGSDSMQWILRELWRRGIGPGLVLVVGNEFGAADGRPGRDASLRVPEAIRATFVSVGTEPEGPPPGVLHLGGGSQRFVEILDAQLERRVARRVPDVDADPAWTIVVDPTSNILEQVHESLFTVANGLCGTRGGFGTSGSELEPRAVVNGIYDRTTEGLVRLLPAPDWTALAFTPDARSVHRPLLDLYAGMVIYEGDGGSIRSARFASLDNPHVVGMRAEAAVGVLAESPALEVTDPSVDQVIGSEGDIRWARTSSRLAGSITAAADQVSVNADGIETLQRIAYYSPDGEGTSEIEQAVAGLSAATEKGFERLLARHRAAWADRWHDSAVSIVGDPEIELAARFALFHLHAACGDVGETAVGARGLTGPAYAGHVFWDTDVFVLPAATAIHPAAARAMLEYRIRRLPAARRAARSQGRAGARFPWESAHDGSDVTPRWVRDEQGRIIPVLTGTHGEHISADVAWAALHYAEWTGDRMFIDGPGRDLVTETARYWASRIRIDSGGQGHIDDVIGPDEYHESVDDNAFTNVMARWTLRRAAELVRADGIGGTADEAALWTSLSEALVDGYDPDSGVYEQFAGFHELEPILIAEIADPPVAADLLLGRDRVSTSQVVKQADVLMLHHLVPDEVAPGSLRANLDFYDPRTAHGSSLSPAIHASLMARAGDADRALELLRIASRLDLDDLTGTTAGGLHIATMGGVWQALAFGFAGLRNRSGSLNIDPHLPRAWDKLELRLRFRSAWMRLGLTEDRIEVAVDAPITVSLGGTPEIPIEPPGATFERKRNEWSEVLSAHPTGRHR